MNEWGLICGGSPGFFPRCRKPSANGAPGSRRNDKLCWPSSENRNGSCIWTLRLRTESNTANYGEYTFVLFFLLGEAEDCCRSGLGIFPCGRQGSVFTSNRVFFRVWLFWKKQIYWYRNLLYYGKKHFPGGAKLGIRGALLCGMGLRIVVELLSIRARRQTAPHARGERVRADWNAAKLSVLGWK